jgi:hypothetical protein
MVSNMRTSIVRRVVIAAVLVLVLGAAAGYITGYFKLYPLLLAAPVGLALGAGVLVGWDRMRWLKARMLATIPRQFSFVEVAHGKTVDGHMVDWKSLDDFALQLKARGYVALGWYAPNMPANGVLSVAACFINPLKTTIVEVQRIQLLPGATHSSSSVGVHFSIFSLVGGTIRTTTTDHRVTPAAYLLRYPTDVFASYPGMTLFRLLEKHEKLLEALCERTNKYPSAGLTIARYVLLQRERFAQTRARVSGMNGYKIAGVLDAFERSPQNRWAPPSDVLPRLPDRTLAQLDAIPSSSGAPLIIGSAH